jgi:hypothetical protein
MKAFHANVPQEKCIGSKIEPSDIDHMTGKKPRTHRVRGTMQKEHMLLQPRVMLTNAACEDWGRTGATSAYVSSRLSCTLIACCEPPAMLSKRRGKSRYASGPAQIESVMHGPACKCVDAKRQGQ